ncbi:DUF551 domain-containing protein [Klebsiella pneumoniae]|uniref:DUF551 domain-containing protein n=1 Tax=Klebsiella pneumoniae TaxID=573 RepID=UPI00298C6BA3|nr:DUF551 domain-containing protein [Klebsiella pneumoniae]MDW5940040.1 DUF551 domain-containing protein [Klebsiella pneumoniae]MDW6114274.1 DUF551 domain-containing protein [Klebsiella pneumoniae]
MTSKFSIDNRELLQRISSGEAVVGIDFGNLIVRELAAFRLAAMDSEPVAWTWQHREHWHVTNCEGHARELAWDGVKVEPLYRHAQPPMVPGDVLNRLEHEANHVTSWHHMDEHSCKVNRRDLLTLVNACRATMLAAAPHDTPALNSVQNVVTVPGKWIPVSERMPEDEQEVLTINKMGHRFVSFFDKRSGLFFDRLDAPAACCIEHVLVTHWMPLPAAPQEIKS